MSAKIIRTLLLAAVLMTGAAHADNAIRVVNEYGTPVAQFKVGDSHCVLKDDQIRCTPVGR